MALSPADIEAARKVVTGTVVHTPLERSTTLSEICRADMHLKLENFQRTGSFKVRGGLWKIHNLDDAERGRGVVAASAGNHAQGVAFAATRAGVKSTVFMPEDATLAKIAATKRYGAEVRLAGRDYQEAYEKAVAFQGETGATFVHAFDDPHIMAGQGTLGLELYEDLPDVETVLVPIGGGGLVAGVATALKGRNPDIRIIGVQAAGASTVAPSLQKGRVVPLDGVATMADGIACRTLGSRPFEVIQRLVDEVVTVEESEIAAAILWLMERAKVVVEGAGAVTLAAALQGKADLSGQKTCCVVSGGNVDMNLVSRIIRRGLVQEGRIAVLETPLRDRPGELARFLDALARHKANVLDIQHERYRVDVPVGSTVVQVHVETRGASHIQELQAGLGRDGYTVRFGDPLT